MPKEDADMSTLEIMLNQLKSKDNPNVCDLADMLVIKDSFDRDERREDRKDIKAMHTELFGNGDPTNSLKAKVDKLVEAEEERKNIWKNIRKVAIGTVVASFIGGMIVLLNIF